MALDERDMQLRETADLANDLLQARDRGKGCGRAVFLVGAGCSVSAGIPSAVGVARHAAIQLAEVYSGTALRADADDLRDDTVLARLGDEAFEILAERGKLKREEWSSDGRVDWGALYLHFFDEHLKAPNQQRKLISEIVELAGGVLNWTHACLGELVHRQIVHSVLTTNFDQLVLKGIIRTGIIPVIADGAFAFNRILGTPPVPQVVHLHGSMHTYSLRNSRRSIRETKEDDGTLAMMNAILQQCDVLVVVGYAGGEDGVMDMLLDATRRMEGLVVYWVVRDPNRAWGSSARLQQLLVRENKFVVRGGDSDVFFANLMSELRLGQPEWMRDPGKGLLDLRDQLVAPVEVEGVAPIIRAFRGRVEKAAECATAWKPEPAAEAKLRAAELRSKGEFAAARAALEGMDLSGDPEAARLHALNALSLFEADPFRQRHMLDAALEEFAALVGETHGRERAQNLLHYVECLEDLAEADGENKPGDQQRLVDAVDEWLPGVAGAAEPSVHARLLQARAVARHSLADAAGQNIEMLKAARPDYAEAVRLLEGIGDRSGVLNEVKEGLAGALQAIGTKEADAETVRHAVRQLREVVDAAPRNRRSAQDGALEYNLAGALADLIDLVDPVEGELLRKEALEALARARAAFEQQGDVDRADEVNSMTSRLKPPPAL